MRLQVGHNKMKTHIAEGGETAVFDFAGSLEVSDGVTEMLCELKNYVTGNRLGPARLIGQVLSSSTPLPISSTPDCIFLEDCALRRQFTSNLNNQLEYTHAGICS